MKNFLDSKKTSSTLVKTQDNKILVNLGAWNEWGEGAFIEPGYGPISPIDPFGIIKTVARIFEPTKLNGTALMSQNVTIASKNTVPSKSVWNLGTDDSKYWYVMPFATLVKEPDGNGATLIVARGTSFAIEGATNIPVNDYKGVSVALRAQCRTGITPACIKSIGLTWYTTSCSSDTLESCSNKQAPNKSGTVFITPSKCVVTTAAGWIRYEFIIPGGAKNWTDRLELLKIGFAFKDAAQNATYIGLGDIRLIPK